MSGFRGTIAQMVEAGVSCNGVTLNQPELSLLTRLGNGLFAIPVGKIPPEGQGKPAIVWEVSPTDNLKFSVPRGSRKPAVSAAPTKRARKAAPAEESNASNVTDIISNKVGGKGNRGRGRPAGSKNATKPTEVASIAPTKRRRRSKAEMEAAAASERTKGNGRRARTVDLTGGASVAM